MCQFLNYILSTLILIDTSVDSVQEIGVQMYIGWTLVLVNTKAYHGILISEISQGNRYWFSIPAARKTGKQHTSNLVKAVWEVKISKYYLTK